MDFVISSLGDKISKKFKTYKHKLIAKQVLELIITQFNTIQIQCTKCNNHIFIKDYINHLLICKV